MIKEENDSMSMCANCGKGEECGGNLKACTACKLVKYCNRDCQIAHRPQHKKACKKRAADLHDEALFKEHPSPEDCPICFLLLPGDDQETFYSCCGKNICVGCIWDMYKKEGRKLCPFCRFDADGQSDEGIVRNTKKLIEKGNADAYYYLAGYYALGDRGMPQDRAKANGLYLKAGELGCAAAYFNLGNSYYSGDGVEVNKKKGMHYFELAAMNGFVMARHNLGCAEQETGNYQRAMKHFIIAASAGFDDAFDSVKDGYMNGQVTKDEYTITLRAYQKRRDEMKSGARDKAASILNQHA